MTACSPRDLVCVSARTRIVTPPQDAAYIKGSNKVLPCTVEHDPEVTPVWAWYHMEVSQ